MSTKLIMIFTGVFLFFTLLNCVIEGTWFDATSLTLFNVLSHPLLVLQSTNPWTGISGALAIPINLVTLLWDTFTFDYSFLTGMALILRLFFCVFSFGFLWGIAQLIMSRGATTGA